MEQKVADDKDNSFVSLWGGGRLYAMLRIWPELLMSVLCPVCFSPGTLKDIVPELNDDHEWSREQIADWLDKL